MGNKLQIVYALQFSFRKDRFIITYRFSLYVYSEIRWEILKGIDYCLIIGQVPCGFVGQPEQRPSHGPPPGPPLGPPHDPPQHGPSHGPS